MPAVIYTRISQDRSGEGLGVERQRQDCERLAKDRGIDVIGVYEENGKSAYKRSKPRQEWAKIEGLVRDRKIDTIIGWHIDRLYRDPLDLEALIDLIESGGGVTILTVQAGEMDLNTSAGRMVARMLGAAARAEVERKSERQARKHTEIAEAGRWKGGRRPLGYEADGVTVNEAQAAVLREAARRIIAGYGLRPTTVWVDRQIPWTDRLDTKQIAIYEGLSARDRRSLDSDVQRRKDLKLPSPLSPVTLKRALTAPRIAGWRQHWTQRDRERWEAERRAGKHDGEPLPMGSLYPAEWKGVLDDDIWRAVRAAFDKTAKGTERGLPPRSLLSGIVRCDQCGCVMGYSKNSYKCGSTAGACGGTAISTKALEGLVEGIMTEIISKGHGIPLPAAPEKANRAVELDRLQKRMDETGELYAEGIMSADELRRIRARIGEQIRTVETELGESAKARAERVQLIPMIEGWERAGTEERALVVRAFIERITIKASTNGRRSGCKFNRDRVAIRWRA